jgi:hypothetical protein
MAGLARRLRPLFVAVVAASAVAVGPGACDCSNVAHAPDAPACFVTDDCPDGMICTSGSCIAPLPTGAEGEGSEGEGEGNEGEGEGEGNEGEGESSSSLIAAPPSLALPSTDVGAPVDGTVQLVNVGDATLTIASVASSDQRFTVSAPATGTTVGPSSSTTLAVRFVAATAGTFSSTITVRAGVASTTVAVTASATQPTVNGTLLVRAGPDDAGVGLADCACSTTISPANVDVAYVAPSTTCRKPADLSCGISDNCAPCNLGAQGRARWRAGRTEQPRASSGDVPGIVDEEIVPDGAGADGEFGVQVTLVDDCTTSPASLLHDANLSCCAFIDCSVGSSGPGPQACFDYLQPTSCVTDCDAYVSVAESQDCMARGPVLVRARVTIDDVERDLCVTMTRDQSLEVARVRRTSGAFSLTSLGTGVVEVAADAPCR